MLSILRLSKTLTDEPTPAVPPGVELRTFRSPDDIAGWLALRESTFAGLTAAGRLWTAADFEREFLSKPWWSQQQMWLATAPINDAFPTSKIIGAVTLGRSGRPPHDEPCVMWLMVDPQHRRRGIGQTLLTTLERRVWDDGKRSITLETHALWADAVRLYEQNGYRRT